jgi:hypothetical protein
VSYAGRFDIPVPPGNYTLEVESIFYGFAGGSNMGPLDPPIPAPGTAAISAAISVTAGGMVVHNITLQGTASRFDAFESAGVRMPEAAAACLRRQEFALEKRRA